MSEELVLSIGPTPGDDVYLNLGRAIAGQCPSGFEEARLDAEMGEAAAAMRLACTPEGGGETSLALDPLAQGHIQELLEEIRAKTIRENEGPWRKCTVTLRKGGRFAMDVYY